MNNSLSKLGFTIIILFISCAMFAQENSKHVIDSISAVAKSQTGEKKMLSLAKLAELEVFSPNLLHWLDDLEKEATEQENDRFLLYSYNYRITYYMRNVNHDSVSRYSSMSGPIVKSLDPTHSFATHNEFLKIVYYNSRGLFDLALINQKRYLERIESFGNVNPGTLFSMYIGIGETYFHQEKYKEALKYFNQAKNLSKQIDYNPISGISITCLVALCNVHIEDYIVALEYCDMAKNMINDDQKTITPESRAYLNFLADIISIQAYAKVKEFKKAKKVIDQLPGNLEATFYQEQKDYYYNAMCTYYTGLKEYKKAILYAELGINNLKKNNDILNQPTLIKEKASLLYNMQNYKDAYDQLLHATQSSDSIRKSNSAIQLDELAIEYEVDLKDAEITKINTQLKFTQTIIIALVVSSILLLAIIWVARMNSKKQQEKNKVLFKQQEEYNQRIVYYKKMIVEEASSNTLHVDPLFQKLEDYMLNKKAYKEPDISRENIASALNTNRQYLSNAIKDATGLTYTNYINKYRLEDARKQLLESDEIVIGDIIIESGFSSRPTFHRLFKEQYGMAPHELKRVAIALQNEIKENEKEIL